MRLCKGQSDAASTEGCSLIIAQINSSAREPVVGHTQANELLILNAYWKAELVVAPSKHQANTTRCTSGCPAIWLTGLTPWRQNIHLMANPLQLVPPSQPY